LTVSDLGDDVGLGNTSSGSEEEKKALHF